MLTKEQLQTLKEKLVTSQAILEKEITELKTPPEFGSDVDSLEEESDEAEERGNQLGEAHALKKRLILIATALERMENGTYGTCEKCHKEISFEMLSVDPESASCKECKLASRK